MTGSEATFGKSTDNGIRLAMAERNAAIDAGTLKGRKIEVKTLDDAGKPITRSSEETRLWQKRGGHWKHVHVHRSLPS